MADERLYINNFRGRAGRRERAKHLRDEFLAIEAAFARLQALNIATYLTIYTNTTVLSGVVTIVPDNGYLQELTLTADTAIQMAAPLNESRYRVSLLIHGSKFKVTNLWGAQTWKEYGLGSWWELWCGEGPYASMLLDFYWDICSHTWICVASSKNQFNLLSIGTLQRFYPLRSDLTNIENDDTLGFSRASSGMIWDHREAYHYLINEEPRFGGIRYIDNWCATPSDLTTVAWVATNCTVTTDAGAGPSNEDVQRLSFDMTGGKLATFVLPAFGRASRQADPIKVAVSFQGKGVSGAEAVRVFASFMGKTNLTPRVHDAVQVNLTGSWDKYGVVLDILKEDNDTNSLTLDHLAPKTLIEIAFVSPSGSSGGDIQVTDVQIEVLRATDAETVSELQDGTIGASMVLSSTGTGTWVDGTKTMTLAAVGQYVEFGGNLSIGKAYLVHPRLTTGDAADIRMQNEIAVWAAGNPTDDTYLQDAPFVFRYDGGSLKFVLIEGSSSIYLIDIYEMAGNHGLSESENNVVVGANGSLSGSSTDIPITSGILDGVAREIASTNQIPFTFFRTFSAWDAVGLTGVDFNNCKSPVKQSEYGIDQWPSRATLLQGVSKVTDGFIQREFVIPQSVGAQDFTMWIRRSYDVEGNVIVTPQHNEVVVPASRYVDFEAELTGGPLAIGGGRIRLDLQEATFVAESLTGYNLGIFLWEDWFHIVISLTNDGFHDGFRVRVYPASNTNNDPASIDVTTQGWTIIDWAQFEDEGGTFFGSSPIVGGETRIIEEFTSTLQDGDFYRIVEMEHVATLTSNDLIWDNEDGVYKNLLYSSEIMIPDIVARNMHEFGLVEPAPPPIPPLTVVTTTIYPIEIIEGMDFAVALLSGTLRPIPEEALEFDFSVQNGSMTVILLSTGPHDEALEFDFEVGGGSMTVILLSTGPHDEAFDFDFALLSGNLESKLVTALMPDEGLDFGIALISGSMTPV